MKKSMHYLLFLLIMAIMFTGCGGDNKKEEDPKVTQEAPKEDDNPLTITDSGLGVKYTIPKLWNDYAQKGYINQKRIGGEEKFSDQALYGAYGLTMVPTSIVKELQDLTSKGELTEEQKTTLLKKIDASQKDLFGVFIINKDKASDPTKIIKDLDKAEKLGTEGKYEYYFLSATKEDSKDLSKEDAKIFEELLSKLDEYKQSIEIFKPITPEEKMAKQGKIGPFNTQTIKGKKITENIFKDYKLTMINIWATTCGYCIEEMPMLEELFNEMKKEDVNFIGLVTDGKDQKEVSQTILDKKGVTFANIIPDQTLNNQLVSTITGTPTTVFVNNKGELVGKPIVGTKSKEEYKKEINERLKQVQ